MGRVDAVLLEGLDQEVPERIVAYLADGEGVALTGDPVEAEGCRWWPIAVGDVQGWVPEGDSTGVPYLVPS